MLKFNQIKLPKFSKKSAIAVAGGVLFLLFVIAIFRSMPSKITLLEYDNYLQAGAIQNAIIDNNEIIIKTQNGNFILPKEMINLNELGQKVAVEMSSDYSFIWIILILVLFGFISFIIFKFIPFKEISKSKNKLEQPLDNISSQITPVVSNISFDDVAGISEVKSELIEIVDFLKNPSRYTNLGIKMPKGLLMVGPPGVGKTLIAKAVAGEANVPFFYQSGANFVQIYAGMGAKRVRELFSMAKSYAPSIIFIDEIDAVGKARGGNRSDEREATLNQLLTEMDGFLSSSGVIVIAATNKIEMIDEALLRSGRFDRRIFVSLPDITDRSDILNIYLQDKRHNVDIDLVARSTTGFSGAALATLVNEAAINALRNGREIITNDDFKAVENRVIDGKKRIHSLSQNEKQIQAIYQSAKALMAEFCSINFNQISLLNDKFGLSDSFLSSKTDLLGLIKVHLAGISALDLIAGELYTNSKDDLKQAKNIAKELVMDYGMGTRIKPDDDEPGLLLEQIRIEVDELVVKMRAEIESLAKFLIENESASKSDVIMIIKRINNG
ncbi:integral membrane ATP-dependent zinc metallopeptidase [Campylobacter vicugnae]|uniref:Integral membrane ATP-dependent zinc metallopeptidase n=1 Tax=Campylobacter vicugnae TaxID=1660076 RepID=A0A1X9T163_9BACT|nr:AAA family ATPase [Campylobacter sp. RM8964]ARR02274.1 integral membrane ATP-dependent zinc metallopeptidase [Campylobacter sp. RM8964]